MVKIVLITGGMGGIGSALCKAFAKASYQVVTTYLDNDERADTWLADMQKEGFMNVKAYKCDVSNYDSCCKTLNDIKQEVGNVGVLINDAGITCDATLRKMTKDMWDKVLRTNLDSMFNMCKPTIEHMIENAWGRIINISSINGQKGQLGQTNYSAAKAGIHGFTMALAQELARKNITVNTIAPGYIATNMVMAIKEEVRNQIIAQIPLGRLGKPEEIAALALYMASDDAAFMTGSEIAINGGQYMH